ncbi:MAG TPA: pseudouridine synthase [Erysipelothrix sp.]
MKYARKQKGQDLQKGHIIEHEERKTYRLNKYISDAGVCSRREADRRIEAGRVTIDGVVAVVGQRVEEDQIVAVDGQPITLDLKKVYIALNKPVGITCTTDTTIPGNISDFMNYPQMIFPIGRLDKDSSGLILLTNDGDIVNKILREEYGHDKEYIVTVNKDITQEFVQKMQSGVKIYNPVAHKQQVTQKCDVEQIGKRTYRIILSQGLNRQIRRMTKALGYRVKSLKRVRIMNISLKDLKVGEWRYLSNEELKEMNEIIQRAL